uniref:Uncharacterized protein LOC114335877 n=1 Tax=Diabrotica virgifera virgifera TaxID=50390 RepID=A0A6P7G4L6_DIAVI
MNSGNLSRGMFMVELAKNKQEKECSELKVPLNLENSNIILETLEGENILPGFEDVTVVPVDYTEDQNELSGSIDTLEFIPLNNFNELENDTSIVEIQNETTILHSHLDALAEVAINSRDPIQELKEINSADDYSSTLTDAATNSENPEYDNDEMSSSDNYEPSEFSDETETDETEVGEIESNILTTRTQVPADDGNSHLLPLVDSSGNRLKTLKKRKRGLEEWQPSRQKLKREKGENYLGRKKEHGEWKYDVKKQGRSLKPRCSCVPSNKNQQLKCSTITDNQREHAFNKFWTWTWAEKKMYIKTLVVFEAPKRKRDRKNEDVSRRSKTVKYYLKIGEDKRRVCKKMFLSTLDLKDWFVMNCKQEDDSAITENLDNEPQQALKRLHKKELANLYSFFDNLPKMESHYCRQSTSKLYLEPLWQSKGQLYNVYKNEWCPEKRINSLSLSSFKNAFSEKRLALYRPKKDLCEICVSFKTGNIDQETFSVHQLKKQEARLEKIKDKNSESIVLTMDLQAVLLCPKSNVSSLYYRKKLTIHNFTFYNLRTKQGHCFLWDESEGNLTSAEFASVIVNILEKYTEGSCLKENVREIIIFSDGCTYQNRNVTLANAILNFCLKQEVTVIQKYLEKGHTQMEADMMHSAIERQLRGRDINVPGDYMQICKRARKENPFVVTRLYHDFFKDFRAVNYVSSIRPGKKKGDAVVTDIRAIKYSPQGIHYKLRFGENWIELPCRINKKVIPKNFADLPRLYTNRISLKQDKFEHLQYLKNTLDSDYHSFYDNLPH